MGRAYLTPRLGRRQTGGKLKMVTPDKVPGVRFWLRADLGVVDNTGTTGYWEWTDQIGGLVSRSPAAQPTTVSGLNNQKAMFINGATNAYVLQTTLDIEAPWSVLAVCQLFSGIVPIGVMVASDGNGSIVINNPSTDPTMTATTPGDGSIKTSAVSAYNFQPICAWYGSVENASRLRSTSVTHTGLTGGMSFTSGLTKIGDCSSILYLAEVIAAETESLLSLAPYLLNRYKVTL